MAHMLCSFGTKESRHPSPIPSGPGRETAYHRFGLMLVLIADLAHSDTEYKLILQPLVMVSVIVIYQGSRV